MADVLYYNGDGAPNLVAPKHTDPGLGAGYDYDVCNAEVLLTRLAVKDGRLVLPDGMNYRLLVLPETDRMPVEVIAKLKELVAAGATAVGPKPRQDPGLRNYPECDREVQRLAQEIWGDCDGRNVKAHAFGKGRMIWGIAPRELLREQGTSADFEYSGGNGTFLDFIHRTTDDGEFYFVANRENRSVSLECTFRVNDREPEIWDPVTAQILSSKAFRTEKGRTVVAMDFASHQSFFVVFPANKKMTNVPKRTAIVSALSPQQELSGAWTVKFDPKWGGPSEVEFASLQDWTKRSEDGIRYYSGTATYVKHFDLARGSDGRLFLDLGVVKDIADVRLNGKSLGIVWTAPWKIEVTDVIKPTGNILEIEVVNLWPNRLIGDTALPKERRRTWTNIPTDPKAPLLPSGLLGPVVLQRTNASP